MKIRAYVVLLVGIVILVGLGLVYLAASQLQPGGALAGLASRVWTTDDALLVVGLVVIVVAILAGMVFPTTYLPTLWALAPLVPGLAAICVVATYFVTAGLNPTTRFLMGVEIGAVIAVFGAIPLRILATVRVAQTRSYWELRRRSEQLEQRLGEIKSRHADPAQPADGWTTVQEMALAEAEEQLAAVHRALFAKPSESLTNGLEWVSAMGYVSLWRRIDRAEEALIEMEPAELVLGDALHDQLRLAGAGIKSEQMESALYAAVEVIDPTARRRYFAPPARPAGPPASPTPATEVAVEVQDSAVDAAGRRPADERAARAVLREVRHAINSYIEDKMESIARARNRLWRTILLTATTTFLLVGIAVLNEVPTRNLIAASVFFLVAAVVGLFNRLRLQATADSAVEDFNLFEARLVHTPLASGLAGVAGVFLVAIAPAATSQPITDLGTIFSLDHNLIGIAVAAGFGLAPERILGPLQDQTELLKKQVKAGQAAVETSVGQTQAAETGTPGVAQT